MRLDESLEHVLGSQDVFGKVFYDEFFGRFPEVRPHFEHVDMDRQALVLTMALTVIQQHHTGNFAAVDHYLQHLGGVHHRRAIPEDSYPKWRQAMLAALERFHAASWSPTLAEEWSEALKKASGTMLRGYTERTGV